MGATLELWKRFLNTNITVSIFHNDWNKQMQEHGFTKEEIRKIRDIIYHDIAISSAKARISSIKEEKAREKLEEIRVKQQSHLLKTGQDQKTQLAKITLARNQDIEKYEIPKRRR